jgi:hypothetical protein
LVIAVPLKIKYTHRMKNESYEIIVTGYNNQLLRWDARKRVLEDMIKELDAQYSTACDAWEGAWRERQQYINEHEEKLEASK